MKSCAPIAQLVEQDTLNVKVIGSNPIGGTISSFLYAISCMRADGGTGRRAWLRTMWRDPWGFKSLSAHQFARVFSVCKLFHAIARGIPLRPKHGKWWYYALRRNSNCIKQNNARE